MAKVSSEFDTAKVQTPDIPEFLPEIINCKEEDDPLICELAQREKVALIAFIAPQVSVRVSPVQELRASIGLLEEFGVEALVNKLQDSGVDQAYMLVNSPGGAMDSSFKIAMAIRTALKNLSAFVPHVAASGGTLLTVAANEIYMGPMSHITPLDTQTWYKGSWVSATSAMRFYQRATRWFEKKMPEEAPYPQRALTDKLDPYLMEEWNGVIDAMTDYVSSVVELAGHKPDEALKIARQLVSAYPIHSYVIHLKAAQGIGLNAKPATEKAEVWDVMRHWLGKYLIEQEMTHCIRYAIPDNLGGNVQVKDEVSLGEEGNGRGDDAYAKTGEKGVLSDKETSNA